MARAKMGGSAGWLLVKLFLMRLLFLDMIYPLQSQENNQ
jgi:hypothetical protein